jgi:serine/threonine protein kinase
MTISSGRRHPGDCPPVPLPRHHEPWPRRGSEPIVGGYRLLSRIGTGGTATVFLATPLAGGPPVAVKILRQGDGVTSCEREFTIASAVDVACTAAPIGHGVAAAGSYLVTAYLPDYRCGTAMIGETMPIAALLAFGAALADTLGSVHDSGVVHCDVKPSNLLVGDNDVRVIDFGISQYVGECIAGAGFVKCSRGWAAPEQLRGVPLAPSADVFAWGCLLAYLATGFHPYAGRHEVEWILRVGSGRPELSGLHRGVDAVVRAALAHDPGDRPSARERAAICLRERRQMSAPRLATRPRPAAGRTAPAGVATAARDVVRLP